MDIETSNTTKEEGETTEKAIDSEYADKTTEQLESLTRMLDTNIRVMKAEHTRLSHEIASAESKLKENYEKIKLNKQLPYLVSHVVEVLENDKEDDEGDVDGLDLNVNTGKSVVIKTSTKQTIYLPVSGLVPPDSLKPGDLIGVNKDSYLILDMLPTEYDSRVKSMQLDTKPSEDYCDIGGLSSQITELKEAVSLPIEHPDIFLKVGIKPPRGVLLHGPPGTGKTLLARAVAATTKNCAFLKLAAPSLVQMYIGDGSKLVRDCFSLARSKAPAIIFIDELDAIGTKRFDSDKSGDREVQRTMLELLNQMDGFSPNDRVSVIAATNRPELLDPALLRSGRLDRKIELPMPDLKARVRILEIHSSKMNVDFESVNFEEIARSTEDFNGAQLKAVCVEAGMIALKHIETRAKPMLMHQDFVEGIAAVQAKKKVSLAYYA